MAKMFTSGRKYETLHIRVFRCADFTSNTIRFSFAPLGGTAQTVLCAAKVGVICNPSK